MTTLEDLYYGNISPHERYIKRGTRVDKLVKLICKNEEELNSTLTEKQKETFEKVKDCTSEEVEDAGKIGVIIVKDQSRLGREHIKTNHLMEIAFHTYNVRFIAINDGYDSLNVKDMDFSGIRNYFNDFYAADTSKKIRAVQKAKGERGEHLGTAIPYGYLKNPEYKGSQKEHPYLIVNPETAPVVKRIFELYAGGTGIRKICAILEKEQIMSPSVYAFKRTGNRSGHPDLNNPFRWTQTTVRGILANQEYCGDTVNFRTS